MGGYGKHWKGMGFGDHKFDNKSSLRLGASGTGSGELSGPSFGYHQIAEGKSLFRSFGEFFG
jgi:hypothetical protein